MSPVFRRVLKLQIYRDWKIVLRQECCVFVVSVFGVLAEDVGRFLLIVDSRRVDHLLVRGSTLLIFYFVLMFLPVIDLDRIQQNHKIVCTIDIEWKEQAKHMDRMAMVCYRRQWNNETSFLETFTLWSLWNNSNDRAKKKRLGFRQSGSFGVLYDSCCWTVIRYDQRSERKKKKKNEKKQHRMRK